MKVRVIVGVVIAAALGAVAYWSAAPRAFVSLGRGAIGNTNAVTVTSVTVGSEPVDYDGKRVEAGAGHKFVLLDCRFSVPVSQVSFDDFQLVRDRATTLGEEVNVGENDDGDAFYWSLLDGSARPVTELPGSTMPFTARLAFKVPSEAQRGYLFYWGLYWGPLVFDAGGAR